MKRRRQNTSSKIISPDLISSPQIKKSPVKYHNLHVSSFNNLSVATDIPDLSPVEHLVAKPLNRSGAKGILVKRRPGY